MSKILPLKSDNQVTTLTSSCRWNRHPSTTAVLYAIPLVLLMVLTRDSGSTDKVAQKVAEIYEDNHVIIAFVSHLLIEIPVPFPTNYLLYKQWSWKSVPIRLLGAARPRCGFGFNSGQWKGRCSGSQDDPLLERFVLLPRLRLWPRPAAVHRRQVSRHHLSGNRRPLFARFSGSVWRRHVPLAVIVRLSVCGFTLRTSTFCHGVWRIAAGGKFPLMAHYGTRAWHICLLLFPSGDFRGINYHITRIFST